MYRRDLITAEIQKLTQVFARIMGLKLEGKIEESDQLFENVIEREFDLPYNNLLDYNHSDFENYLKNKNFPAEKLELLGKFLYFKMESFEDTNEHRDIAERLLQLYGFMENEHHISSFESLGRQKQIKQFLAS